MALVDDTQRDVDFWDGVGDRFPSLKGATSTGYYFECERLLLEDLAGNLGGLRILKTDLWDEAKNTEILRWAAERNVPPDRFEFQMLYGIRRDLQNQLVNDGYRVRVYVPFGREWFPYFMRRLGERPANVAFVLRGVLGENG